MTNASLEQRAILAVGWLRKAARLAAPGVEPPPDELPPNPPRSAQKFAKTQCMMADAAVKQLTKTADELHQQALGAAEHSRAERKRLAEQPVHSQKAAATINKKARRLAEEIAHHQGEASKCERLLRILRGQEDIPLPVLPLHQYAAALERLEESDSAREAQSRGEINAITVRGLYHGFLQRTSLSDRIALMIALVLCLTIIGSGLYYIHNWGRVELEIQPLDDTRWRVTCINSTRNAIFLNVPYTGDVLPRDTTPHYGVLLKLMDADGESVLPDRLEALWKYKDLPAHLHGPIVVGPMFAAEFILDLSGQAAAAEMVGLTFTLYRAPQRPVQTYAVTASELE